MEIWMRFLYPNNINNGFFRNNKKEKENEENKKNEKNKHKKIQTNEL